MPATQRTRRAGGLHLPPRPFLDRIVLRAVIVWAVLRAVGSVGSSLVVGGSFVQNLAPNWLSFLWITAVVVIVLRVEAGRRQESLFLANLGVSFARVAAFAVVLCAVLDLALAAGLSVMTGA